jgi:uncharacterized protein YdeI (YjbR/CyaY-like superfamily)
VPITFDPETDPVYFASAADLGAWLEENADTADELWVGFYRASSGKRTLTWEEVVDEALCVGWIDGIRKGVDSERFAIRLTPRRRGSNWSAINVANVERLRADGRIRPAGERVFALRIDAKTAIYSYEGPRNEYALSEEDLGRLRADHAAWAYWNARPPSYRRLAAAWIMTAKKEDTRRRRMDALIEDSAARRPIKPLR